MAWPSSSWGLLLTLPLTLDLMVLHEWIHGLVAWHCGGSPEYGAMMMGGWMPVFYCTSPGDRFNRKQFLVLLLAPTIAVSLLCGLGIAVVPYGGWLVIPAAVHLGGCIGDHWMTIVVLRQPPGTLVEGRKTGMRFYQPATYHNLQF